MGAERAAGPDPLASFADDPVGLAFAHTENAILRRSMTSSAENLGRTALPGAHLTLILYYAERAPLRSAIADHLYAFQRYGGRPSIYVNLAVRGIPAWIDRLGVDVVIFHTILLAQRWQPRVFRRILRQLEPIRRLHCLKVAIPQDEFIQTDLLTDFIRRFEVDHVLSCAPESEWRTIYGALPEGPTTFTRVLTGYIERASLARIDRLAATAGERPIDIGYRAWQPEYWLGRHGQLKGRIAEVFASHAAARGLRADISLRDEDTLLGDDWYRFLLRSRWAIGVEGGASLIDRDGSLRQRTLTYQVDHPAAPFEEVEAACFPDRDGSLGLVAISPRHLEACATRTAQVLVEGSYNGILEAGVHYLPLRRDFANIEEVLDLLSREEFRTQLADRAYRDIVASRRYEYSTFVQSVLGPAVAGNAPGFVGRALGAWERRLDLPSWWLVAAKQRLKPSVRNVLERTHLLRPLIRLRAGARDRAEG